MDSLLLGSRIVLAVVFATAGVGKLLDLPFAAHGRSRVIQSGVGSSDRLLVETEPAAQLLNRRPAVAGTPDLCRLRAQRVPAIVRPVIDQDL